MILLRGSKIPLPFRGIFKPTRAVKLVLRAAIPAGAPSAGLLSASCPLIGASDVKGEGFLDDSGMELAKDSAMAPPLTNSDLAGCSPAGIAVLRAMIDVIHNREVN